ncbi:MAG: cephalosporin hydroxylase family protein [Sneathiellales bacterium]|nr:cephalosporin hydroxylase family protein [Sneathiellales bacterium]
MTAHDDRKEFEENKSRQSIALGKDQEAFRQSTDLLTKLDEYDYSYLWSWMGVPIIQMPADIMATQEVIWATKPDVIIETGVARGGSVIFMASLLEVMGQGQVIGVDIDIRKHNRQAIEEHPMSKRITLIEGGSADEDIVKKVEALIPEGARVMVVLDSDHSRDHVLAECRAYGRLVTEGCYLVVADTLVGHLDEENAPKKRSKIWYKGDEPLSALNDYMSECDRFEVDEELNGKLVLSSSPGGYLRCIRP